MPGCINRRKNGTLLFLLTWHLFEHIYNTASVFGPPLWENHLLPEEGSAESCRDGQGFSTCRLGEAERAGLVQNRGCMPSEDLTAVQADGFAEKTRPYSSQLCVMGGQERVDKKLKKRHATAWKEKYCNGRWCSEKICLHPWRFSGPDWKKPWNSVVWHMSLSWARIWVRDVQRRSLPIWIMWASVYYSAFVLLDSGLILMIRKLLGPKICI